MSGLSRRLLAHPTVRRAGGQAIRRLSGTEDDEVVRLWSLWATARLRALGGRTGVARGTAVYWPRPGRASAIARDVPLPAPGEVLIRTAASVVSPGTERAHFIRLPNAAAQFPVFPGYSAAGEVLVAGRGVTRFHTGDRVAAATGHSSLALVPEHQVYSVPDGVPLEEAGFVQLGVIAMQAWRKAMVSPGESVAVIGHGVIGQLLVQIAAASGAHPVISIARTGRRITDGLRRAATSLLVGDKEGTHPAEAPDAAVTFDATGDPEGIATALGATRRGGRIILVGSNRGRTRAMDFGLLADKGIIVMGAHVESVPISDRTVPGSAAEETGLFFGLLARGEVEVGSLISERVHPLEAERFYRDLSRSDSAIVTAVFCWDRLTEARRYRRVSYLRSPDFTAIRRASLARIPLPLGRPA